MKLISTQLLPCYGFDLKLLLKSGLYMGYDTDAANSLKYVSGFNFKIYGHWGLMWIKYWLSEIGLEVVWYRDLAELSQLLDSAKIVKLFTRDPRILRRLRRQSKNWGGWEDFANTTLHLDRRKGRKWRN